MTGPAWSLVFGAALTLAGKASARSLTGASIERRTAILTAAALLDVAQLACTDGFVRPDLVADAQFAASLVRSYDALHGTALAFHGPSAPSWADHEITDLSAEDDWSVIYGDLRYLRREWAAHRDLLAR
ncbi:hypothetical protein [Streptomyces sp. NPDC048565]|uniref:hypothetical protein n=1 Tax=unclassified Streptomyces TaxID=2593676 RepID=UPI003442D421